MRRLPPCRATLVAALSLSLAGPLLAAEDLDLLAGLKARSIGPAGMSGRTTAIDVVLSDPRIVYIGAASGGVWKSTDGAMSFQPIFDDQKVHSIGALAIHQANPAIVWVGTGEGNPRNSASVGYGVYKSVDAGETWQHLGLEATERIYRVLLHPSDPNLAYVCALGREWGENPERGVFKTVDGGKSWVKVLYVDERTGCADLVMDPSNPNKLFAAMWQFRRWPYFFQSGGPGSGLFASHDGGTTWKRYEIEDGLPKGELGRMGIAISASNPEIVYVLAEAKPAALLRSDDGGKSFRSVNSSPNVAPRPFYYADIRVDPRWPNRVYNLHYSIEVSDDGGKSFQRLPGARGNHGDNHALWINPKDPRHLFATDDGGVFESRDQGLTFRHVTNLPLAQFYHLGFDLDTPYHVYGGLQDNGSWRGPSAVWQHGGITTDRWDNVGWGDGFDVQPDPQDSTIGYSMWQGGNLARWNVESGESRFISPQPTGDTALRFNWNAGLAIDPFEPATIYYGSQFVHRSRDRGESWEVISPDLTTNNPEWQKQEESGGLTPDVTTAENHTTLLAIAPSPVERGVIWAASDDGRLHVTRDDGKTWTSVEKNLKGVPANTWIPHVEVSKFIGGEAFVVLDNHRRSDWTPYVYRTTDYGATWKSLATADLWGYALVLEQDPVKADLLYLGTEFGLFVSTNGGAQWHPLRHGLPTASVMDLAVHPREHDLIVATHGRAIYIVDDIRPLRDWSPAVTAKKLHLFAPGPAQQHSFRQEAGSFAAGITAFRGENPPYGAILDVWLGDETLPHPDAEKERERQKAKRATPSAEAAPGAATPPKVEIVVSDAAGKVVRTLRPSVVRGLNRFVWGLDAEAPKEPPRERRPEWEPGGAEVAPGTYRLSVRYGDEVAQGEVVVRQDPRSTATAADWQARGAFLERLNALNDRLVDAIVRVRTTRDDIAIVSRKVREQARFGGEKDEAKLGELPLVKSGTTVSEGLTALESKLWRAPEAVGYLSDTDTRSRLGIARDSVAAGFLPPSPTHELAAAQAAKFLEDRLAEVDAYLAKEVATYRDEVAKQGIGLLGGK
jgi:photosystem II stability/assembly factor-like uncharacterized protein